MWGTSGRPPVAEGFVVELLTRIRTAVLLIAWAILILLEDGWAAPWYPFLFLSVIAATLLGVRELLILLPTDARPHSSLCFAGITGIVLANWHRPIQDLISPGCCVVDPWHLIGGVTLAVFVIAFFWEMAVFTGPGKIVERLALTMFVVFYLGVLPSFLIQLRWLQPSWHGTVALGMTVFVPKCCDIGAYFTGKFLTGRFLGRTLMTPLLSPKKTVQGAIGGLLTAILTAVLIQWKWPILSGIPAAIGFGLVVGLASQLGDLMESLIKRDSGKKDASRSIPGFGGVLDVIDSLLVAAPVAYLFWVFAI